MAKINKYASITAILILVLSLVTVFIPAHKALAITPVYVNVNTGSDHYDGSSPTYTGGTTGPKRTIAEGFAFVTTGGIVNVAAGTYNENLTFDRSFTLAGAGAASTIINSGGTSWSVIEVKAGTVTISGVTIQNGYYVGSAGGLAVLNGSTVTVNDCVIKDNVGRNGGGVLAEGGSTLYMNGCTVSGNSSPDLNPSSGGYGGGGIWNANSTVYLTNCTISGNSASDDVNGYGGGILNSGTSSPTTTLVNCTVVNNSASGSPGRGGGFYNSSSGTMTFKNTIVANNTATGGGNNGYNNGTVTSYGYNIDSEDSCGFTDTTDQTNTNPLLGPLHNNGGATPTCALLGGSPAIDAGTCSGAPTIDQRGVARPWGASCDIGAYELTNTPNVTGDYSIKGSVKFYDWKCNKWIDVKGGTLHITYQDVHKVEGYWEPDAALGWSDNITVKGYVGPFFRDAKKFKIKNTPRLSLLLQAGEYCTYPDETYATYILNGKVKMDKKTELVKSIKFTINGWGEYGDEFVDPDQSASQGQLEGKFTATPVPGGITMPGGSVEYAPSAMAMPGPGLPASPPPTAFATPMVAAGGFHTVGLKSDGIVVAAGYDGQGQCNVGSWTNITQVDAGWDHTVGLESDGTVVAVGDNSTGQCSGVSSWTDITQVSAGDSHTVGLESGGTVVAVGQDNNGSVTGVGSWAGITQVAAGGAHTVGLVNDGTVVAVGWDDDGQVTGVGSWAGITQVAAGSAHTVGLTSTGTVVAVGLDDDGQLGVGSWTDITQVAAGGTHTVGLKSNGTVVAVGDNSQGQCDVGSWTNIIQVAAGYQHTVGLKADGSVVAVGNDNEYQCSNVTGWNLAAIPGVIGDYPIKGSIKFYDWKCNKWLVVKGGTLHIITQNEHKITGYFEPDPALEASDNITVNGYIGPFVRDAKGKVKNTPRLSLLAEHGKYCTYPVDTYTTFIINGKVKWDKKLDKVKSIKCTINGWGEFGGDDPNEAGAPNQGQFEGKFTATPMP